ncbi:DUF2520 domain-containing protein [Clostridium aestuarii]|uniref:DUF2520 domain-containing protein n=1 Tax=Clostridium aestuarii TaxID=338193 RepID=A0ABT4D132_9CLOT|nr:DUF2520 domain-containing protein [Clostridium aestuarii]
MTSYSSKQRSDALKIGFIGAGKVGFSLGKYFSLNNVKLTGYYSRTYRSALKAAEFTETKAYNNLESLIKDSDTIFITTPDDAILSICEKIISFDLREKIICHTSGSLSSNIFSNLNLLGVFGYSIHPMFPFPNKYTTYKNLKDAYFSIEGSREKLDDIKKLIQSLGNKFIVRDENKDSLYHLANVTVSNLVLSLLNLGCTYLQQCGVREEDALEALFPLIESNISNLKSKGFVNALTGPIERGDSGTVKQHIEAIPKEDLQMYKILSKNLLEISKKKNSDRDYKRLQDYLGGI